MLQQAAYLEQARLMCSSGWPCPQADLYTFSLPSPSSSKSQLRRFHLQEAFLDFASLFFPFLWHCTDRATSSQSVSKSVTPTCRSPLVGGDLKSELG